MNRKAIPFSAISRKQHGITMLLFLLLSMTFYGQTLNNPFWHDEDFTVLETAQSMSLDPEALFELKTIERHHPLPLLIFLFEYESFGLDPTGYYVVNLFIHAINAFLVYWLVIVLLPDRRIAILSGILFVLGVGSYGKAVMFIAGVENLFITMLYLLILNLYIRNDLFQKGRVLGWRYLGILLLFLMVSLAKPTAFSLVGGLLAYKLFFRGERGSSRKFFEPALLILVIGAFALWIAREISGVVDFSHSVAGRNPFDFTVNFVKNMILYVVHMFFPIHVSRLVETSHPAVQAIYVVAPVIRGILALCLFSYSLFGFIFGNRTIRFFLIWTFISILPYCAIMLPDDWLNIRFLYQVSVGFCFIMASGTVLSMDLLHRRRWRRFFPFVIPLLFVLLSAYITHALDRKYENPGQDPDKVEKIHQLRSRMDS